MAGAISQLRLRKVEVALPPPPGNSELEESQHVFLARILGPKAQNPQACFC